MAETPVRVLAVGGSDSSGGAGIQADLKTALALGAHGMSVVCAVTSQDSHGVQESWDVPAAAVAAQLRAVLSDIGADAVKTGMLATEANVAAVAGLLRGTSAPVVVDPVLATSFGQSLAGPGVLTALRERLLPLATVVTPNLSEAAVLSGTPVADEASMTTAAAAIHAMGPAWVLVKGGHLAGQPVDLLYDGVRVIRFPGRRIDSPHTHGTGCTLACAIAVALGAGDDVPTAVGKARRYVADAITAGFPLGTGTGPLGHRAAAKAWPSGHEWCGPAR